jgi:hypothetical protein
VRPGDVNEYLDVQIRLPASAFETRPLRFSVGGATFVPERAWTPFGDQAGIEASAVVRIRETDFAALKLLGAEAIELHDWRWE